MQCIIATSYIYTVIAIYSEDGNQEDVVFIKNIEFQKNICHILDIFQIKYNIKFYTIFNGPAPLLSLRTTLSFIKGMMIFDQAYGSENKKKIVLVGGYTCYWYTEYDMVVIQNFSGKMTLLYSDTSYEVIMQSDFTKKVSSLRRVGLVARENASFLPCNYYVGCILFPSLSFLSFTGLQKFQLNDFISDASHIVTYK